MSFDAVPVSPAATVMLVDDRPDLHVLMVKRTNSAIFAPDAWVFPGGRVDPEDHLDDFDAVCWGLSDANASSRLGVASGGLAWWLATCRETLEEAGLLLATDATDIDVHRLRQAVQEDEGAFIDKLLEHGLRIDASAVEDVAQFITPPGSPRRFDARFFVALAPQGQEPVHDKNEIVDWEWVRPQTAIDQWRLGNFQLLTPTTRMLSCLAQHDTTRSVLELARQRLAPQEIRVGDAESGHHIFLPGEVGYEQASTRLDYGWVSLWQPELARPGSDSDPGSSADPDTGSDTGGSGHETVVP